MVFNFAAWDQGVDKSKEEFRAKRAENAALYADFIKSNPDASVEDRELFKNNLAGNSKFLTNALPSRDMMEKNVARRKQQVAAAAAARKQAALKQNIAMAGQLSKVYGSAYVSGGEEAALSAVKELAGGVLPDAALPLVQQFGREEAQQIVNKRMQPKFELWKTAGASPSDIKSWDTAVSEEARDLLAPWVQQAQATVQGLRSQQEQQALANSVSVINTGDDVKVDNYINNLSTLYPHLGDGASAISDQIRNNFNGFVEAKKQRVQTAVDTAIQTAGLSLRNGETNSVDSAVLQIEAEARKLDPSFQVSPAERSILETALNERLHQQNNAADIQEKTDVLTELETLRGPNQFIAGGEPENRDEILKIAKSYAEAYVSQEDDAMKSEQLGAQALSATEKFASMYNIPINDDNTWTALTKTALEFSSQTGQDPLKVSDAVMRATVDRIMSNRTDPQAKAHKIALMNLGVNTLEEASDAGVLGSFEAEYNEALEQVVEQAKDVYEAGVYTPDLVGNKIEEDVSQAKDFIKQSLEPGENGMSVLEQAQSVIDTTATPDTISSFVNSVYDTEVALSGKKAEVESMILELQDRKRRATIRLQSPEFQTSEMYPRVQAAGQKIAQIDQQITELQAFSAKIDDNRTKIGNQLRQSIQGAARPNIENLEAIAQAIGPLAMFSGDTIEEQMSAAQDLINSAIPELDGINPGIYSNILEELVKENLGLIEERSPQLDNLLSNLLRASQPQNQADPQQPVTDQYGVPQSYYPPAQNAEIPAWLRSGNGNALPDSYSGYADIDYNQFQ